MGVRTSRTQFFEESIIQDSTSLMVASGTFFGPAPGQCMRFSSYHLPFRRGPTVTTPDNQYECTFEGNWLSSLNLPESV